MGKFRQLLFEATDETIRRVFGESCSELIYGLANRHVSLKQEEIGEKIGAFYAFLERLLGSERGQIIQATSLKLLCFRLQREYEDVERYFSFLDELYEIKFKLSSSSLKEQESPVCN
ncbi:MAG: hypothetical protein ACE5KC_00245 [Candidatus Bathyarchaeia archaeon]